MGMTGLETSFDVATDIVRYGKVVARLIEENLRPDLRVAGAGIELKRKSREAAQSIRD